MRRFIFNGIWLNWIKSSRLPEFLEKDSNHLSESAHTISCGRLLDRKTRDNAMKLTYGQCQSYLCKTKGIEKLNSSIMIGSGYPKLLTSDEITYYSICNFLEYPCLPIHSHPNTPFGVDIKIVNLVAFKEMIKSSKSPIS